MNDESKYASGPSGEAFRKPADLKVELQMPQVKVRPMPSMSEDEIYLRLNVPQGLESDGSWQTRYGIVQRAHKGESDTSIKTEDGR